MCACGCVRVCTWHGWLIRLHLEHNDVPILDRIQAYAVRGCLDAGKCKHARTDVLTVDDHEESRKD